MHSISNSRAMSELRSHDVTPLFQPDKTINTFISTKSKRRLSSGSKNEKLIAYKDVKEQMLGTFYVGQKEVENVKRRRE